MISYFEKHAKLSWMITIIIAIAIFYISSLTFAGVAPGTSLKALLYHLTAFFFLGLFLLISLVKGKAENLVIVAVLIAVIYGITDEIHQFFVPGRASAISDVLVNNVGITFAFLVYYISFQLRNHST